MSKQSKTHFEDGEDLIAFDNLTTFGENVVKLREDSRSERKMGKFEFLSGKAWRRNPNAFELQSFLLSAGKKEKAGVGMQLEKLFSSFSFKIT